tara:strand:+ start:705 stop:1109 length:405 start_codon:yes stop_codon:yes gene_type:complete
MNYKEIYAVNQKHKALLEKYIVYVKKVAYFATEDSKLGKFREYNDILNTIISYSNNFYEGVRDNKDLKAEFAYIIPNFVLYMTIGFMTGLKNKSNEYDLIMLIDRLTRKTELLTGEITDILNEDLKILDIEELI